MDFKKIDALESEYMRLGASEGLLFSPHAEYYGAYIDDVMVGYCGVKRYKDTAWFKCDYVLREYRRRGILTEMIRKRLLLLSEYAVVKANCTPMSLGAHLKSGAKIVKQYKNGITLVEYRRENIS